MVGYVISPCEPIYLPPIERHPLEARQAFNLPVLGIFQTFQHGEHCADDVARRAPEVDPEQPTEGRVAVVDVSGRVHQPNALDGVDDRGCQEEKIVDEVVDVHAEGDVVEHDRALVLAQVHVHDAQILPL